MYCSFPNWVNFELFHCHRREIQAALNEQTYTQFRSYAEHQFPGNPDQQAVLIRQLQDQHYQQYMQQVYQQQLQRQQQQLFHQQQGHQGDAGGGDDGGTNAGDEGIAGGEQQQPQQQLHQEQKLEKEEQQNLKQHQEGENNNANEANDTDEGIILYLIQLVFIRARKILFYTLFGIMLQNLLYFQESNYQLHYFHTNYVEFMIRKFST